MAYQIPPDLEARVKAQFATGLFGSKDEVLRQALDTLEKRQLGLAELQAMVREAEADIAAGRIGEFDVNRTLKAVETRLAQQLDFVSAMPKMLRTDAAEHDLEDIALQIAFVDGRTEVAKAVLRDLVEYQNRIADLSAISQMGAAAPELGEGVRCSFVLSPPTRPCEAGLCQPLRCDLA